MNNKSSKKDDLDNLLNILHIDKKKYIIPTLDINLYHQESLIENINLDLICPICLNILKDPKSCSSNKITHYFCKNCIDTYLSINNKCPICKNIFQYKDNLEIKILLNNLSFKCLFQKEGCNQFLQYSNYITHINNCNYQNINYECQVEKLNNADKIFEKCKYKGYYKKVIEHFKLCALFNVKCLCCKKNILNINLKKHIENECKIGILNYQNIKYIGEKKNKIMEGYGILYDSYGRKYEGEWKNGKKEGYGIINDSFGNIYKGEIKNNKIEGIGILYSINGNKYE